MIRYRFGSWSCWKDYCGDLSQTWTKKTTLSRNKNTWSKHFSIIANNNKGRKPYLEIAKKVLWERYLKIIACRIPKTGGEKTKNWLKATSLKVIGSCLFFLPICQYMRPISYRIGYQDETKYLPLEWGITKISEISITFFHEWFCKLSSLQINK
jgi:hypothetical protein